MLMYDRGSGSSLITRLQYSWEEKVFFPHCYQLHDIQSCWLSLVPSFCVYADAGAGACAFHNNERITVSNSSFSHIHTFYSLSQQSSENQRPYSLLVIAIIRTIELMQVIFLFSSFLLINNAHTLTHTLTLSKVF